MITGLDRITINGVDFVIEDHRFPDETGEIGDCDIMSARIRIDPRAAYRIQKRTLFHEILHLIIFMAGYDHDDVKEGVIVALENGIPNVLRDNPRLALLLMGTLSIEEDDYATQLTQELLDSGVNIAALDPGSGL